MKVSIIVLNWNNLTDTLECLDSLSKLDYPHFEVILVDNGSHDGSGAAAHVKHPWVHYLPLDKNYGFAEGNNKAMEVAIQRGADYLLLLNNDTIVDPQMLTSFVSVARERGPGVYSGKILYYDEPTLIWYAGGQVNPKTGRCYHEGCLDSMHDMKWDAVRETDFASGCALFITPNIVKEVGGLEPIFFLNWEEIDWCWRIRKAGYPCLFVPEALIWHKISRSFVGGPRGPQWQYYYARNRILFHRRNVPRKERWRIYGQILTRELPELLLNSFSPRLSAHNRKAHRAALRGLLASLFVRV